MPISVRQIHMGRSSTHLRTFCRRHSASQLIHGDLSGNVLLHPNLPPAIIDLSPSSLMVSGRARSSPPTCSDAPRRRRRRGPPQRLGQVLHRNDPVVLDHSRRGWTRSLPLDVEPGSGHAPAVAAALRRLRPRLRRSSVANVERCLECRANGCCRSIFLFRRSAGVVQ